MRIVVPYADLDLPAGAHQIAYEVAVLVNSNVVASVATPLSRVTISDRIRQQLHPQLAPSLARHLAMVEKRTVQAVIVMPPTRGESPSVVTKPVEITPTAPVVTPPTIARPSLPPAVSVPGGFDRTAANNSTTVPTSASTAPKDLAPLVDQPWTPASDLLTADERTVYFATNRAYLQQPGLPSGPAPATQPAVPQGTPSALRAGSDAEAK